MKAIRLHRHGGPEQLVYEEAPVPRPASGEVLLRVHAAAVTPSELLWMPTWKTRRGEDRPLLRIPGHELSGVVEEVGAGVFDLTTGQEVYGLNDWFADGTDAEYCVAPAAAVAPRPRSIDHVHAGAVPISALTAWQALFEHGRLVRGQRALIHGGSGGVGSFAVQLAHARGAHVIATASAHHIDLVRDLGADEVIDYRADRFDEVVRYVDLVLDTVGGETLERSRRVLKSGGRLVTIAAGSEGEPVESLGAVFFIVEARRDELGEIARWIDAGRLRVVIGSVFPLADARRAYETKPSRGKNVLRVS